MVVDNDVGMGYAVVQWDEITATDPNDGTALTVTSLSYISGHQFPIGRSDVSFTTEDNEGKEETCRFTVTVNGTCVGCKSPRGGGGGAFHIDGDGDVPLDRV